MRKMTYSAHYWGSVGRREEEDGPANGRVRGRGDRAPHTHKWAKQTKAALCGAGAPKSCPALEERESGRDGRGPTRGETDFRYTRKTCSL